tara:strand:- start:262 stop:582 length:321 start_codon:yes stop_codon:yes gene_type:complete
MERGAVFGLPAMIRLSFFGVLFSVMGSFAIPQDVDPYWPPEANPILRRLKRVLSHEASTGLSCHTLPPFSRGSRTEEAVKEEASSPFPPYLPIPRGITIPLPEEKR